MIEYEGMGQWQLQDAPSQSVYLSTTWDVSNTTMPGMPDRAALRDTSPPMGPHAGSSCHTYKEIAEGSQRGKKGEEPHRMERMMDIRRRLYTEKLMPGRGCSGKGGRELRGTNTK